MGAERLSNGLKALGAGMGTAINVTMEQARMLHDDNLARFRAEQDLIQAERADARSKAEQDRADARAAKADAAAQKRHEDDLKDRAAGRASAERIAATGKGIESDRYFRNDIDRAQQDRLNDVERLNQDLDKKFAPLVPGQPLAPNVQKARDAEYEKRMKEIQAGFSNRVLSLARTDADELFIRQQVLGQTITPEGVKALRASRSRTGQAAPGGAGSKTEPAATAPATTAAPAPKTTGAGAPAAAPALDESSTTATKPAPKAAPAAAEDDLIPPEEGEKGLLERYAGTEETDRVGLGDDIARFFVKDKKESDSPETIKAKVAAQAVLADLRGGKQPTEENIDLVMTYLDEKKLAALGWKPEDMKRLQGALAKLVSTSPGATPAG